MATETLRTAVLLTCHNRVATTLQGLGSLRTALAEVPAIEPHIFLVDDGSSDGTAARVRAAFPEVHVAMGDGNLFWNRGMCRAYDEARKHGGFDAYLLFNDDVTLNTDAVRRFVDEYMHLNIGRPTALTGATLDDQGSLSYSGMRRLSRHRPLAVCKIPPVGSPQPCDTFNGNFVMVPGTFFERIGGLDRAYAHSYGDLDLGYVAQMHGIGCYVASNPVGLCASNPRLRIAASGFHRAVLTLRAFWGLRDSLGQRAHFMLKHAPIGSAIVLIVFAAIKRAAEKSLRWVKVDMERLGTSGEPSV